MLYATKLFDGSSLITISLLITSGLLIVFALMAIRLRGHFIGTLGDITNSIVGKFLTVDSGGGGAAGGIGGSGGSGGTGGSGSGGAGGALTGAITDANRMTRMATGGKAGLATVGLAGAAAALSGASGGEFFGRADTDAISSSEDSHSLVNDYGAVDNGTDGMNGESGIAGVDGTAGADANGVVSTTGDGQFFGEPGGSRETSSDKNLIATGAMTTHDMASAGMQARNERDVGKSMMKASSLAAARGSSENTSGANDVTNESTSMSNASSLNKSDTASVNKNDSGVRNVNAGDTGVNVSGQDGAIALGSVGVQSTNGNGMSERHVKSDVVGRQQTMNNTADSNVHSMDSGVQKTEGRVGNTRTSNESELANQDRSAIAKRKTLHTQESQATGVSAVSSSMQDRRAHAG